MKKDSKIEGTPQVLEHSVRCRFFAQYWGVNVLYVGGVGLQKVGEGGWNLKHPSLFLKLRPLSKMMVVLITPNSGVLEFKLKKLKI